MNSTQADYSAVAKGHESTTILSLLALAKGLEDRVETAMSEAGLSLAKFGILGHLVAAKDAIPLSELAARVNCVRSNVTQMVDRLETDGLVRRVPSPQDRRIILAELTELGRQRQAAGASRLAELELAMTEVLAPADREAIERALRALG